MKTAVEFSENVRMGHPDRFCDRVADWILAGHLERFGESAKCAIEVMIKGSHIYVVGEATPCLSTKDMTGIINQVCHVFSQPIPVAMSFNVSSQSESLRGVADKFGAGDQGVMFGYSKVPRSYTLATEIVAALDSPEYKYHLLADGKAQVSILTDGSIHAVISAQQPPHSGNMFRSYVDDYIRAITGVDFASIAVNPGPDFVIGGPSADSGLTGRKIQADAYGAMRAHGGGSWNGKDPRKVDRTGAYLARRVALETDADRIGLSYKLGVDYPIEIMADGMRNGTDMGTLKHEIHLMDLWNPDFYRSIRHSHIFALDAWLQLGALVK